MQPMAKGIVFKTESIFTARFFTILNTRHNLRLPIVKVNAYKVCNKQEKIGGGKHFQIKIIHSQRVFSGDCICHGFQRRGRHRPTNAEVDSTI